VKEPPPPPDPPPFTAFISLDLDVVDSITPAGRGRRVDATFADAFEKKKVSVDVVTDPHPVPKKRRRKP